MSNGGGKPRNFRRPSLPTRPTREMKKSWGFNYEDEEDAATDELLSEDSIEARVARQLVVEEILEKLFLRSSTAETTQN